MVGVGTGNIDMDAYRYNFCSFLGRDADSWGLSYYGKAQFRGVFTDVAGARFGQGSIIGVHLDTWLGRLMFYKNRKPLGELKVKAVYSSSWKTISELWDVTCHMGSHSVTCHPTQLNAPRLNPSQLGWYSIYLPRRDGRLS